MSMELEVVDNNRFATNEVVGYGINADPWSWRVVLVKKRSSESKNQNEYYGTTLGHYKSLESALNYIGSHAAAVCMAENKEIDRDNSQLNGEQLLFRDLDLIQKALSVGKEEVIKSVKELESRMMEIATKKAENNKSTITNDSDENISTSDKLLAMCAGMQDVTDKLNENNSK